MNLPFGREFDNRSAKAETGITKGICGRLPGRLVYIILCTTRIYGYAVLLQGAHGKLKQENLRWAKPRSE